jgi:hypothetical protein
MLRRFATLTALQPLLLGLILLTRRLWEEGGALCGFAILTIVFVEVYCSLKVRQPGRKSLSPITRNSLETFTRAARPGRSQGVEEEADLVSETMTPTQQRRTRGSFASVLDMMSATLAITPRGTRKSAVPLCQFPQSLFPVAAC